MREETVDIEYIGDPPILDDVTKLRIAMGEYAPGSEAILRGADSQRIQAVRGVTKRIVDKASFGTSRDYVFGPHIFTVAVERADAHKIFNSTSGYQFRRKGEDVGDVLRPASNMVLVSEVEGKSLLDIY